MKILFYAFVICGVLAGFFTFTVALSLAFRFIIFSLFAAGVLAVVAAVFYFAWRSSKNPIHEEDETS